jgi:hypothetical protein
LLDAAGVLLGKSAQGQMDLQKIGLERMGVSGRWRRRGAAGTASPATILRRFWSTRSSLSETDWVSHGRDRGCVGDTGKICAAEGRCGRYWKTHTINEFYASLAEFEKK